MFADETTSSSIEESINKKIETEAKALNLSGIQKIHSWSLTDPRSNAVICGVVKMWSLKTSDSANISREQMKDATINRGGHMKAKLTASGSASKSAGTQSSSNTSVINGDTSKYKAQSIESVAVLSCNHLFGKIVRDGTCFYITGFAESRSQSESSKEIALTKAELNALGEFANNVYKEK